MLMTHLQERLAAAKAELEKNISDNLKQVGLGVGADLKP